MDFIKKHGEKVLLVVLLLVLAGAVFMALNSTSKFQNMNVSSTTGGQVDLAVDTDGVQSFINHLTDDPYQLEVITNAFTPEVRVMCMNPDDLTLIPKDAKICPYCKWEQTERVRDTDEDGINDKLELQWGMNPNDPKDIYLDQDNDGFQTIVEFERDTDPTDSSSYPPLVDYLRLISVSETSISFELRGTAKMSSGYTLQMKWTYPDESTARTEYVKVGSTFGRNNEFKAESFTEKRTLIDGKYVDQSRAVIRAGNYSVSLGRIGEERKGKMTERTAELELIMGPKWSQEVRIDQTFDLDKKSYMVVDINSASVVIKLNDTGAENEKLRTIREATQEELDALKPPPTEEDIMGGFMFEGSGSQPPF
ncbi:thrombospondin type 3 repeat-containing protein [Kiritimatiellota bacterium B12222]|nr:thrombospondin type 3 repeat-containing protein [Kiritimatiellota bacterium B12222]